jgi:hypothetical protein
MNAAYEQKAGIELVKPGQMVSVSNRRISTLLFPILKDGESIGAITGDQIVEVLARFDFYLSDERAKADKKTTEILKQNGLE